MRAAPATPQLRAVQEKIRVGEFLRDFDPLRSGFVTAHQLESGLSALGLQFAAEEYEALAAAYADPKRGLDAQGKPLVAWRRFADDVESAFQPAGLERAPEADPDAAVREARSSTESLRGRF